LEKKEGEMLTGTLDTTVIVSGGHRSGRRSPPTSSAPTPLEPVTATGREREEPRAQVERVRAKIDCWTGAKHSVDI
jgi:hypothetical protein